MVTFIPQLIQIGTLLLIVWLLHAKIGEYPEPLPLSEVPKREIRETLFLWIIFFAFLIFDAIIIFVFFESQLSNRYSMEILLVVASLNTVPGLIIGYLFVTRVNGWNIKDLGLTTGIRNKNAWIFAILITIVINIVSLMFVSPTPAPVLFLLVALYQNIFLEEFYFRGVIQSKLERAWGQNKAWIWGGIIFGLMHIINDYAIPLILGGDVGSVIITGTLLLFIQIINGWFLGILYIKTRSLLPCIIVHFISNYLTAILAWFII